MRRYSGRRFRRRRKFNAKKIGTLLTIVVFVVMVLASVRYFTLYTALRGSDSPMLWHPQEGERTQFVLVGLHQGEVVSSSVLSVAEDQDTVEVIAIPPQSLVEQPGDNGKDSLRNIFDEQGLESGLRGIERLLMQQMPVGYFVTYDVDGVAEILDAVMGVEVTLPDDLVVEHRGIDYAFAQGANSISAEQAVPILASEGQLSATKFWAEKSTLVQAFNKLFSINYISYLVTNMGNVGDTYQTNMSSRELARFRDTLQAMSWDNTNYTVLPGQWVSAQNNEFWSPESRLVDVLVTRIADSIPDFDREKLLVDVFNGNGIDGFAGETADMLVAYDIRVGKVTNAPNTESTLIYYQPEFYLAAVELANLLDVEAVLYEGDYEDSDNPVSVILGRDLIGR